MKKPIHGAKGEASRDAQPAILPHPTQKDQLRVTLATQRATKDFGDKPILAFTATDASEDRHGSTINPNGWELNPYRSNPVVLWGHQQLVHSIGKTLALQKAGGAWDVDIEFLVDEWSDYGGPNFAQLSYRIAQRDILGLSVGFIPKEWKDRNAETIPSFFAENVAYLRQELTEISLVNVPSNRATLQKALSDSVISEKEAEFLGLGAMLASESPAAIRTEGGLVIPLGSIEPVKVRDWQYVEPPPIAPEVKAREIEILTDIASDALDRLDVSVERWRDASHDGLRWAVSSHITNAVYDYDFARCALKDWYQTELPAPESDLIERAVATGHSSPALLRAVLGDAFAQRSAAVTPKTRAIAPAVAPNATATEPESDLDALARQVSAPVDELDELTQAVTRSAAEGRLAANTEHQPATVAAPPSGADLTSWDLLLPDE